MVGVKARAWLAVLAVLLGAGCRAPASSPPDAAAEEPRLSAVAVYGRHAAVRGKVDVRMTNSGVAPAEVETIQLRHPLFDVVSPTARRSTLPADGQLRIVPVPFGRPRCEVDDPSGAAVVVALRTPDGLAEASVPLVDGEPGLLRAHRLACAAAAVLDAASVEIGPAFAMQGSGAEAAVRTTLRLRRRGEGPVAVTQLSGNILFNVSTAPTEPVVLLAAGQDEAAAEVLVTAGRCDPHALTESKTSFTFPLFATVGDDEPASVSVTVSPSGRSALQALLDQTCGSGPTPGNR